MRIYSISKGFQFWQMWELRHMKIVIFSKNSSVRYALNCYSGTRTGTIVISINSEQPSQPRKGYLCWSLVDLGKGEWDKQERNKCKWCIYSAWSYNWCQQALQKHWYLQEKTILVFYHLKSTFAPPKTTYDIPWNSLYNPTCL